jgi:hypothetical protein
METLKLVQQPKRKKIPAKLPPLSNIKKDDDLIDLFPLPRYFQVHFQNVHENTRDLQGELVQLRDYVAKVDDKLERLVALLSRPPEPAL